MRDTEFAAVRGVLNVTFAMAVQPDVLVEVPFLKAVTIENPVAGVYENADKIINEANMNS